MYFFFSNKNAISLEIYPENSFRASIIIQTR